MRQGSITKGALQFGIALFATIPGMHGYFTFVARVQGDLPLEGVAPGRRSAQTIRLAATASDGASAQRLIDLGEDQATDLADAPLRTADRPEIRSTAR